MALPKRQAQVLEEKYKEIHEVIDRTKPEAYVALDKTDLKPIPFEDWEDPRSHTAKGISPENTVVNKGGDAKYKYKAFKSLLRKGYGDFYKEEVKQEELFRRKVEPPRRAPGRG